MTYDEWILRGPDERPEPVMEACDACNGTGRMRDDDGDFDCVECDGTGETEAEIDEPDGDCEYEARRDTAIDRMN